MTLKALVRSVRLTKEFVDNVRAYNICSCAVSECTNDSIMSISASVQFNLVNSSQRKRSVKGQPEKMSLEPCLKLTVCLYAECFIVLLS